MSTPEDLIQRTLEKLQSRGRKNNDFTPTPDDPFVRGMAIGTTTRVRILPGKYVQNPTGEWSQKAWWLETHQHKLRHQGFGTKVIDCSQATKGLPCPICQYVGKLWDSGSESNITLAREIGKKARYYVNVVQRQRMVKDPSGQNVMVQNAGPLILAAPGKLFERILFMCTRIGDITALENGHDFDVIVTDQGGWPNYSSSDIVHNQSGAGTQEEVTNWMTNMKDLESLLDIRPYDEVLALLDSFLKVKLSTGQQGGGIDHLPQPNAGAPVFTGQPTQQGSYQQPAAYQPQAAPAPQFQMPAASPAPPAAMFAPQMPAPAPMPMPMPTPVTESAGPDDDLPWGAPAEQAPPIMTPAMPSAPTPPPSAAAPAAPGTDFKALLERAKSTVNG